MLFPYLKTKNIDVSNAYRLAVSTVFCNTVPYNNGKKEEVVLSAGLEYEAPWTRDSAINTWNGCGLICPDITKRTLLGILDDDGTVGGYAGQNWDNIIWVIGAWYQYLYTGDREFLQTLYTAATKTLARFEEEAFDSETGLFVGAACYGDGIAAYADRYATHGGSGIVDSPGYKKFKMCTLSTNCLFYAAYIIADRAAAQLHTNGLYAKKAEALKNSINNLLWCEERGIYYYYVDTEGKDDALEGLGNAFAILLGVADERQAKLIAENQYVSPHGIPCVYPSYSRYTKYGENCFGRHSGTVWPFIQGFWADAAARTGRTDLFDKEFLTQTENSVKAGQFYEIYHPLTGEPYGGLQESRGEIIEWRSMQFQTWSATAYLRNIYMDIFGMRFYEDGIRFDPCGSDILGDRATLSGIKYRECEISLTISGKGSKIKEFKINNVISEPFVAADTKGKVNVEIIMG